VSRQAVHRYLQRLVASRALIATGKGRARRYQAPVALVETFDPQGLEEDVVWRQLGLELERPIREIVQYAFTEMLNNAIDHAHATTITVRVEAAHDRTAFEITDDGIGTWESVRRTQGVATDLEAVQELSKGKVTAMPERHTGEGIFFTSKAVSWFALESGTLRWVVDNERADVALLDVPNRQGTSVRCEVAHDTSTRLERVFETYTKDFAFTSSRAIVKLFEHGLEFVSRSEAKRLARGLEKFEVVVVDFTRIAGVGQGFADELFRVWAAEHPATSLVPVHMNRAVAFFVERARRS
jgi:anti-sigma regulatory factor (Ser/Thr protein kinase)